MELDRRALLVAGLGAVAGAAAAPFVLGASRSLRQPRARVTALAAPTYDVDLVDLLQRGIREYPAVVEQARSGPVVLKPNLVEYSSERPVNTDHRVVAAAIEAFRRLGAPEVVVAEGPGHRRDTEILVEQTGIGEHLRVLGSRFVDLNVDVPRALDLPRDYTGMSRMHFGRTVLDAGLLVSLAKLKTHHWAGATLSMKNLFGILPGRVYGWPKNPLHWAGIEPSIVDIWDAVRPGFAIVDGIVGMEGDGPIMGDPVHAGVLFLGDNLPAVDATAARFMGLIPEELEYLRVSSTLGGTIAESRIEVTGDAPAPVRFEVLEKFAYLQA